MRRRNIVSSQPYDEHSSNADSPTLAAPSKNPIVYGIPESVYVRTVLLALAEKRVAFDLVVVDPFISGGPPMDHLARHPFGKVPAFEHGDLALYESAAILRYIDDAFEGPALTPSTPRLRARMTQLLSILDHYAYRAWVWGLYVEEVEVPRRGGRSDIASVDRAAQDSARCLSAIDALAHVNGPCLLGAEVALCDLSAFSMFDLLVASPTGRGLADQHPRLAAWHAELARRPSARATSPGA
jgi:glutathione S-transferase